MAHEWNQQKGEPPLWYGRFVEFYLGAGEDRTLDQAYRAYRARQAASKGEARDFSNAPPAGGWTNAFVKYNWRLRAQAHDAHQKLQVQKAHAAAIRKANEKHLAVAQNYFGKFIKRTQSIDFEQVTDVGDMLRYAKDLIMLERLLLGMPLTIEESREAPVDPAVAQAIQESAAASIATPETIAEVLKILDAQGAFDDEIPGPRDGAGDAGPRAAGQP